jgi:hypothetical protein
MSARGYESVLVVQSAEELASAGTDDLEFRDCCLSLPDHVVG